MISVVDCLLEKSTRACKRVVHVNLHANGSSVPVGV